MEPDNLKELKKKKAEIKTASEKESLKPIDKAVVLPAKSKAELRQERKDKIISDQLSDETGKFGIDLNVTSKAPLTQQTKDQITNAVKQITSKEFASDIDNFSKSYVNPTLEEVPGLNEQQLKDSIKKQRKIAWADALYAFGQGLQGRTANPEAFASTRLKRERDQQYQNYKTATQQNQKVRDLWNQQYRNDLLDFVKQKQKDTTLTASEKEKYRLLEEQIRATNRKTANEEAQLKARQDNTYYDTRDKKTATTKTQPTYTQQSEDGSWQVTNQKNPYSDLYYKLTGNSPVLINEMAKMAGHALEDDGTLKRNLTSDEVERFANTLLSRMFDFSTDEAGNRIATPKPGMENYLTDLSDQMQIVQNLDNELLQIDADYNDEYSQAKNRKKDEVQSKFDQLKQAKQQEIKQAQQNLTNLLEGKPATHSTFSDIVKAHQ